MLLLSDRHVAHASDLVRIVAAGEIALPFIEYPASAGIRCQRDRIAPAVSHGRIRDRSDGAVAIEGNVQLVIARNKCAQTVLCVSIVMTMGSAPPERSPVQ